MDFALTGVESLFLIGALVVTIPMLIFLRWVIKEMHKEDGTSEPGQDKIRPGTP